MTQPALSDAGRAGGAAAELDRFAADLHRAASTVEKTASDLRRVIAIVRRIIPIAGALVALVAIGALVRRMVRSRIRPSASPHRLGPPVTRRGGSSVRAR